jgi:hypothetical protein
MRPSGERRQTENGHKSRRHPGTHVGDEAERSRQKPPQRGIRDPHYEQAKPDTHPEAPVDNRLHQQVAADALTCLVHGARRRGQAAIADEANQTVAELLTLQQHLA